MDEANAPDHLSSSLTDLMTSLMVIFILLLLVFVSNSASKDATATAELLKRLEDALKNQPSLTKESISIDPRDPNAILIVVSNKLMGFDSNDSTLSPAGAKWLESYTPSLSKVLCSGDLSQDVDSIVVEGHTDRKAFATDSEKRNIELSQKRSMAVVVSMLGDLSGPPHECFLRKLSATGRGEQDALPDDTQSRRVIFRIRVKAATANKLQQSVQAERR